MAEFAEQQGSVSSRLAKQQKQWEVKQFRRKDEIVAMNAVYKHEKLEKLFGMLQKNRRVWVSKLGQNGSQSWVEHQGLTGYVPSVNLAFGVPVPGLVNSIPGQ